MVNPLPSFVVCYLVGVATKLKSEYYCVFNKYLYGCDHNLLPIYRLEKDHFIIVSTCCFWLPASIALVVYYAFYLLCGNAWLRC